MAVLRVGSKCSHTNVYVKRFFKNLNFAVGFVLSTVIILMAIVSLAWTPYDANKMDPRHRLKGPSISHPLGTDQYGRDIFSRVMVGAVNSIIVGLVTVAIGLSSGVALGLASAYYRGLTDEAIMRLSDFLFGFPAVLTAILITSILGPSMINAMLAVALSVWQKEFIVAARAAGISEWSITWRHVLPNILSPLLIQGTIQFAVAILAEAGLSYLGLGTQPPYASWGRMLNEAQTFMSLSPWMAIFPGVAIAWAVLGFNLLGDGLRDTLDPRMVRIR